MQHDNFQVHAWVLSNGKGWHWEDFGRSLNVDSLDPNRITRPISDLVRLMNVKFRAFCWDFIPPHPSLSCYWPLSFFVTPFLLFKFFKNMGCYAASAFGGTCLYLGSIGFLSPLVMLLLPAKALVNFLAVLSLYLGSKIYKNMMGLNRKCSVNDLPYFWQNFVLFLLSIFLGFFCDETGLFVFVLAAFIFYPIFFQLKERLAVLGSFMLLPIAYIGSVFFLLPYIHFCLQGRIVNLGQSYFISNLTSISVKTILTNMLWLFYDHPHVQLNTANLLAFNPPLFLLQLVYTLSMCILLILLLASLRYEYSKLRIMQIMTSGVLLFIFVIFQSFLLLGFYYHAWGIWYYGSLFSLLYFLFLTFVIQFILENKLGDLFRRFFILFIILGVCQGLVFSVYRVDIPERNRQGYCQIKEKGGQYTIDDIFNGRIRPYYRSLNWVDIVQKSYCRRLYAVYIWEKVKQKNIGHQISRPQINYCQEKLSDDYFFPLESKYLSIEL